MIRQGNAIVIDVKLTPITGQSLFRLALWNDDARARVGAGLSATLPPPCRAIDAGALRVSWLEGDHWLIACAREQANATLELLSAVAGTDGTIVEVTAALQGCRISGPGWRDLLMIAGVFDAESPDLVAGSVARTVMHHSAVLIDVLAADSVHAYVPSSYAEEFFAFWEAAVVRLRG
jgi:heterotetrameric sarcosine oxidase gamma subunit